MPTLRPATLLPQVYFIASGAATLESHDKKGAVVEVTRAMLGLHVSPAARPWLPVHVCVQAAGQPLPS